jgi:hypothetical protein
MSIWFGLKTGCDISHRGIDPNPEKVSAITIMKPPESLHDIQKVDGVHGLLEEVHLMTRHQRTPFL